MSVVTLSFNQVQFLEQAIKSVIQQNYPSIEYIVVDPGSTDGSRELIARYEGDIDCVVLEPDTGPADGLNHALERATGDLFAYINADDVFLPNAFLEAQRAFAQHRDASVVYGNGYFIDEFGTRLRRFVSDRFSLYRSVSGIAAVMQQATFFRLDAVKRVGGFVERNRTCWDKELLLDIALSGGEFVRVWRDWGLFRIHSDSITGQNTNREEYERDCARQFEKVYGRLPRRTDIINQRFSRIYKILSDPRRSGSLIGERVLNLRSNGAGRA